MQYIIHENVFMHYFEIFFLYCISPIKISMSRVTVEVALIKQRYFSYEPACLHFELV